MRKPTAPKRCTIAPRTPQGLPVRCRGRVVRAGRCAEHLRDWEAAKNARWHAAHDARTKALAEGKLNKHQRVSPPSRPWVNPRKPYQPPEMRFAHRDVSAIDAQRLERAQQKRTRKATRRLAEGRP